MLSFTNILIAACIVGFSLLIGYNFGYNKGYNKGSDETFNYLKELFKAISSWASTDNKD